MTRSDLRQRIRDKSVVIFAIIVPLALMAVLDLVIGDAQDEPIGPVTVAASVPAGDDLAAALVGALDGLGGDGAGGLRVTVKDAPAEQVRDLARNGEAQVGLIVPDGFGASLRSGTGKQVTVIEGDGGIGTQIVISVLQEAIDHLEAGSSSAIAGSRLGLTPAEVAAAAQSVAAARPSITLARGAASNEQLSMSGALVAGQAGLFLLFTVGFGVLALVYERDQGTLARLRSMPMRPGLVVGAKALVAFILGVVATSILLTVGGLLFGVDFGSVPAIAVLVLCVVTASTSLMFIVARVARTSEQASIAQSIVALVLGIAGGAFFPIAATGFVGTLLDLNPISAFIRGLGITYGGGGIGDIGVPVLIMLGFAVVAAAISRVIPDRGAGL
ncbi:MAG: ABC transporter permease [Micrococcales bacterium]|nr:ABC transporter permease [Micrococcales bacterium]